jgi:Protein of unknown function (DUF3105)
MGKASKAKPGRQARIEQVRSEQRRSDRHRIMIIIGAAVVLIAGLVAGVVFAALPSGTSNSSHEVMPPGVSGPRTVQAAVPTVPDTSGISGVVAYDTTGWPQGSHNGPAAQALSHSHVAGPVTYSVTPPVGGPHNAEWMNCGIYDKPVPAERAVHNLEHGAVWITYSPSLPQSQVDALRAFAERQSMLNPAGQGASRYLDLSPYPGLPSPIVVSSWGFQLRLSSPSDPRLQQFVNKFRVSQTYTPEYGSPCTGGVGTPLQT